ncbi:magnesium/cobalt transporter CorA [Autumnicola psychrophila]|uniref:Magnesium transport protein CorA n=1 Tax=Autumnicola psychrophila TaxID=3075592 RepID=A0ABU3DPN2_9FLAO|nr:magnesium/cobalt transporter CorA [Zunongwangia sp. F225]MDT0685670.1 magnesium/cobalt transporter CorA [Zunongwangia sp. F225]
MSKLKRSLKRPKFTKALHQAPGTMTYVGNKETKETLLEVIDYNKDHYQRYTSTSPEDAFKFEEEQNTTWINIDGLNNTEEIEKLGKYYDLHPLIMEDIVNTGQRPKIDEYPEYLFIVAKMLYYNGDGSINNEHLSIVVGKDYVLTFQEAGGDVFDGLRERIKIGKGRIRSNGADYLMFALLDAVIDNYFAVVDDISDKIELFEDRIFHARTEDNLVLEIQELKRTILRIRRAVFPLREVVNRLLKVNHEIIEKKTESYIRDLHDHMIQISENIDLYREMIRSLLDMYMSTISNKMNEVMKVLTIMASIFIPLTFIAGIYGMNFEYMPELQWKYSYFVLWGIMLLLFIGMIFYFKRKKWL